jgi:hypothetical protein
MTKLRTRFSTRIKDPQARRFFAGYFGGKLAGLGIVALFIAGLTWYLDTPLGAATMHAAGGPTQTQQISAINTTWVLGTAFLVFFMQAGFISWKLGSPAREVST